MGYKLVLAAYAVAERMKLDHAPARVFVYMALRASDDDAAPVFYAGRDALALALGVGESPNGYRAVQRVMTSLRTVGVIESMKKGSPNNNSRYLLRDGAGSALTQNTGRSASPEEETGDAQRPVNNPEQVTLSGQTGDAERSKQVTLSDPQRRGEEKEEGGPPSRFCSKHPKGTNGVPCGACREARLAAEAWRPPKTPKRAHVHQFDPVSGYCTGCELREDHAA